MIKIPKIIQLNGETQKGRWRGLMGVDQVR